MVKSSPLGSSLMLVSPSPDLRAGYIPSLFTQQGLSLSSLNQCLSDPSEYPSAPPLKNGQVCWALHSQNTSCPGFILCPSQLAPSSFFSSKLAQKIHLLHPSKKWRQPPIPFCSSLYKNSNILEETPGTTQNGLHTGTL